VPASSTAAYPSIAATDPARYVRLLSSVAAGIAVSLIVTACISARTHVTEIDFHVFYRSALAWTSGGDLYATTMAGELPNLNPPQFIVAFVPLTWMAEQTAIALWLAINVACLIGTALIVWRELQLPRSFTAMTVGVAAAGLNMGLQFGIEEGHPVGIFALALTAAWAASRRQHWTTAAVLIGLVASVKPFFGCVLLIAVCRGQWRACFWSAATATVALLAGLAGTGIAGFARWLETGRQVTWFNHPLNASLAGLLARAGLGWQLWALLAVFILLITVIVIRQSKDLDVEWLTCGVASLLVSPLGWAYYLPLLAGPLAAIAVRRPALLLAAFGFVWPMPYLMTLVHPSPLANATVFSLTSWSLIALWCTAVWLLTVSRVERPSHMAADSAPAVG
jgi:hypothetical protein